MPPKTKKVAQNLKTCNLCAGDIKTEDALQCIYWFLPNTCAQILCWSYHQALQTASGHFFTVQMPLLQGEGSRRQNKHPPERTRLLETSPCSVLS